MHWLSTISDERWVDIITRISLLSAAGFGLLALFTEYRRKEDGKITGWGMFAAFGIVGSAVLSIAASAFQDRVEAADAKLAKERREEDDKRFQRQIAELGVLKREMAEANAASLVLHDKSDATLAAQDRLLSSQNSLLTSSRSTILRMAGLSIAQRQGTDSVLRGLWNEANRIEGGRMELLAAVKCETASQQTTPLLFRGGSAIVTMLNREQSEILRKGPSVVEMALLADKFGSQTVFSFQENSALMGPEAVTRFHSFGAYDPDEISSPEVWRTGSAITGITAPVPENFADMGLGAIPAASVSADRETRPVNERRRQLPCTADLVLFVNGRQLTSGDAPIIIGRDAAGILSLSASPPIRPIQGNNLPRYGAP